eukprot:contig_9360_g2243
MGAATGGFCPFLVVCLCINLLCVERGIAPAGGQVVVPIFIQRSAGVGAFLGGVLVEFRPFFLRSCLRSGPGRASTDSVAW